MDELTTKTQQLAELDTIILLLLSSLTFISQYSEYSIIWYQSNNWDNMFVITSINNVSIHNSIYK